MANTEEGGLWHQADDGERLIQQSPALVRDEALNAHVRNLVCTLAGPQCATMRVYVVDMPFFNAFCAPNGMMVRRKKLDAILFIAPAEYYFDRYFGTVEKIFGSIRVPEAPATTAQAG